MADCLSDLSITGPYFSSSKYGSGRELEKCLGM